MLDREEISRLVSDEFVEIDEAIKEYADLRVVLPQLSKGEMTFSRRWFYHVVHLTK